MINLLLLEDQARIKAEYKRRRWLVAGWLVLAVLGSLLVAVGSLYYLLFIDQRAAQTTLAALESEGAVVAAGLAGKAVTRANEESARLLAPEAPAPTTAIEKVVGRRGGAIVLDRINYRAEGETVMISLGGRASTRKDFLMFIEALKAEPDLTSVESPIDNLIRERDVVFSIEITLKPTKS